MAHPRPFRFGVQVSSAADARAWTELARKVEDLGFSTLLLPDHFGDQLAPVPALGAAAAVTERLRLGALVWDNDYKHPLVFAKEMATLDLLSDGRLELGIGAGWMIDDYTWSGIPYDEPKVRIDRLEEGLRVIKGAFGPDSFSHEGTHYTISGYNGLPKPVQQPGPPILIGGGGRRMLRLAAREADIVGISPNLRSGRVDAETAADARPGRFDEKVAWVREAAGDRYDDLELNCLLVAVLRTDDTAASAEMMAPLFGVEPSEVLDVPVALIGSEDEMVERLQARRERWDFSYCVVQANAIDTIAPVVARLAGT